MKTKNSSKLTVKERKNIILNLCQALSSLRKPEEVADALTDLLTPKEVEIVAKRLQIAELLVEGKDYNSIREQLKVGLSTIARVNTWLNLSGEGFKIMISRKKPLPKQISNEEKYDPYSWHNIKRRYSLYFWPQLLVEELMKNSDKKQKKKIHETFDKLQLKKQHFSNKTNKQLYDMFSHQ